MGLQVFNSEFFCGDGRGLFRGGLEEGKPEKEEGCGHERGVNEER